MSRARTKVAVIFGGRSSEHSVSCVSAGSILEHLDPEQFEVVPIGITEEGAWVLGPGDPRQLAPEGKALPSVDPTGVSLALTADPTRTGELVALGDGPAGDVLAAVDVVFPVLHGPFGEDGTIQGMLDLADVRYNYGQFFLFQKQ